MIGDEVSESAKAIQEVAKTTKAGIEATEKLGGFVSRIIGEPTDAVVGILTDKLKFMRWERQVRLTERAKEIINSRNIEGELRTVPPKIALPIIENASLEENDELQDLWAHFLASAVDPNFDGTLRTAFIDIIKQLEVVDVHILNFIYSYYSSYNKKYKASKRNHCSPSKNADMNQYEVKKGFIMREINIDEDIYKESIDNLIRVRCVAPFVSNEIVNIPAEGETFKSALYNYDDSQTVKFNITHQYDKVCITPLGVSFAKACMLPKSKENTEV